MCAARCVPWSTLSVMRNVTTTGVREVATTCVRGLLLRPMTTNYDLLGNLRLEWRRAGRSPSAREACGRVAQRHPELQLGALEDLHAVVALLETRSGRNVLERAQIVRALLEEASDPDVHRALLQTLLPASSASVDNCDSARASSTKRARPFRCISLLSELLVDWADSRDSTPRRILLSALRGRLRRWLLKEKAALRHVSHFDQVDEPAAETSPLLTRLETLRGGEHDRLVRLTYARVFEGRSLRELAAHDHSAPLTLQSELQHFAVRFLL